LATSFAPWTKAAVRGGDDLEEGIEELGAVVVVRGTRVDLLDVAREGPVALLGGDDIEINTRLRNRSVDWESCSIDIVQIQPSIDRFDRRSLGVMLKLSRVALQRVFLSEDSFT
jgi:hypothetical protein